MKPIFWLASLSITLLVGSGEQTPDELVRQPESNSPAQPPNTLQPKVSKTEPTKAALDALNK